MRSQPAPNAELRLRGGVAVEVTWPLEPPETPALLVVVGGAGKAVPIWPTLARGIPAVLLDVRGAGFDDACEALEWGADHAEELGADPSRLLLAAEHAGAGLVSALARHARDRGWPPVARHLLVDPGLGPARVGDLVGLLRRH